MENNFVLSLSLFSFVLLAISISFKHSLTQSHKQTHTHTAYGVTNFSWALDFGVRAGEKEEMKEGGEAVVPRQHRGSHPHRRSLIPPLISSFWPPVCLFCLKNQFKPRACSMCVAPFETVAIWSLFTPQFQVLETHHKECARYSHLWGEIEI